MVKGTVCKHCSKRIVGKVKLVGLATICPHCGKPSEEIIEKR